MREPDKVRVTPCAAWRDRRSVVVRNEGGGEEGNDVLVLHIQIGIKAQHYESSVPADLRRWGEYPGRRADRHPIVYGRMLCLEIGELFPQRSNLLLSFRQDLLKYRKFFRVDRLQLLCILESLLRSMEFRFKL